METSQREREKFTGIIRPFRESDVLAVREILKHWLQDDGVIAYDEVDEDIADMRKSSQPNSNISMFVAEENGNVVGMMGLSIPPKDPLMQYAKTDRPSELRIAYVHANHRIG